MDHHKGSFTDHIPALQPAPAASQQAVVIGIGDYAGDFPALSNAPSDALAIADILQTDFGFTPFPDGGPILDAKASRSEIMTAVEICLSQATAETRWLFYFAGHGTVSKGKGYLIPEDAVWKKVDTYISVNWLLETCKSSACGKILLILDSCYSGQALIQSSDLKDTISADSPVDQVIQVITSGNPDQPVLDGGATGHSIFTQSLLEALQGWVGVHEENGAVHASRLLDHLVLDIPRQLKAAQVSTLIQRPIGGYVRRPRHEQADFTFEPQVPRLPTWLVANAHHVIPGLRKQAMADLVDQVRANPALLPLAVTLSSRHLQPASPTERPAQTVRFLYVEPDSSVREQAADTLGKLDVEAGRGSLIRALTDDPLVCRAAAYALSPSQESDITETLLNRLRQGEGTIFVDLMKVLGRSGSAEKMLQAIEIALMQGKVVPFIGPDFSRRLTCLPARKDLVRDLANRIGIPEPGALADIAKSAMPNRTRHSVEYDQSGSVDERPGNRYVFNAFLRERLDDQGIEPGPVYQALSRLPVSFWLSGTYDRLLARVLNASVIFNGEDLDFHCPDGPRVVQLAGRVDHPEKLRVLESDFKDRLRRDTALESYLHAQLQGKLLLLLGFDPGSLDFLLIDTCFLQQDLSGVNFVSYLVWPSPPGAPVSFASHIHPLYWDTLPLIDHLAAKHA